MGSEGRLVSTPYEDRRRFVTGLDLGQQRDYTAIAVLERTTVPAPDPALDDQDLYAVRHLERLPLGTSYTAVCDRLVKLFDRPPLTDTMLAVDETGVGRPVVDLLDTSRIQADIRPITITGGHEVHQGERLGWKVPKKCLVSTMQVLLQGRRLTVAKSLAFAPVLVEELRNFQVKITESANETFGAWRDGQHDDLVLAIACAAWAAEHVPQGKIGMWIDGRYVGE
jgi:hypothetical protein